jgi:flagellin
MGFRVNTNVDALKAYQQLANANKMTSEAQLRMASGKRIQQVADDTSGFNIGTSLKGKVAVMKGAQGNIAAAKNLMSTAEGALLSINDLLTKIEGKMSDATNPTTDRTSLANDIKALANEIDSIINNTKFNDTKLFSTSAAASGFNFQVGELSDTLNLTFAASLGCTGTSTGSQSAAVATNIGSFKETTAAILGCTGSVAASINMLSTALGSLKSIVSDSLGQIGNFTQRLNIKDDTLNIAITNAESSISRLFDADMAMEQLNATKGSILQQASTAMFAQLNFAPQQVLQLFG